MTVTLCLRKSSLGLALTKRGFLFGDICRHVKRRFNLYFTFSVLFFFLFFFKNRQMANTFIEFLLMTWKSLANNKLFLQYTETWNSTLVRPGTIPLMLKSEIWHSNLSVSTYRNFFFFFFTRILLSKQENCYYLGVKRLGRKTEVRHGNFNCTADLQASGLFYGNRRH